MNLYLHDLSQDDIEYVSIKVSSIFSQINLVAFDYTIEHLAKRLRQLYRVAHAHKFTRRDGTTAPKFVNLDMEEYRDLRITVTLFKKVLEEPEFHNFSAGIVLQAYLPDSHEIQKELTTWAMQRVKNKGAPIKIRIVKGANLAMERCEASLRGWPQAPYLKKTEVDANYKRMVAYGCIPENAKAAHIGIASHNLFDIAFALLLRREYGVEKEVSFEMLEGMAESIRKAVQLIAKDMLLYCPVATKKDFQNAVAYLIRRLDENTGVDNFLRHAFGLKPYTHEWQEQAHLFEKACELMHAASLKPRRTQDRTLPPIPLSAQDPFENEADTDFSLMKNKVWIDRVVEEWKNKKIPHIPCVIGGKELAKSSQIGKGFDPSHPQEAKYTYTLAEWSHIDQALITAKEAEGSWRETSLEKRSELLRLAAQKMREKRGDLIGVMILDGGKTPAESDPEISEAIDFAEYYWRSLQEKIQHKDITLTPKGTVLVTPPWNFPISIPAGGIFAALVAGNCVIFKPAPEAVLSGWMLVNMLWDVGIPKDVLQFVNCVDEPIGSLLIKDKRVNMVCLTGATATAKLFLKLHPGLDLSAETGGKNAMIITALSDRDLAIKDLLQSAFGHSGQKCSAASLAILEAEVYDDPLFHKHLKDAAESLKIGSAWDLSSKIVPLIHQPEGALLTALTSLEKGEEWLIQPRKNPNNPNLWSPGIKIGVKEGSFTHKTEFFGPVLGIMRAKNLEHAIHLVNGTPYGLTSGLHSLDEREQTYWMKKIEAGNLYINRSITGAIVQRQPFGGCKASHFGSGAKAGGPNYISQFFTIAQNSLPKEKIPQSSFIEHFKHLTAKIKLSPEETKNWEASFASYAYWGKKFQQPHDSTKLVGQDNFLSYKPEHGIVFRIYPQDSHLDILRICLAATGCNTPIQVSFSKEQSSLVFSESWKRLFCAFKIVQESEEHFLERIRLGVFKRIRILSPPSAALTQVAAESASYIAHAPVLANGRFELLHYLREVATSTDYHRYGNLGEREAEVRKPIM
ncbi:MAG: bifunctional proline dehydrogenase/L-glutamate gamma-semialdehyde dehydrogenase [Rhabdochlamydiaceae bacterium]